MILVAQVEPPSTLTAANMPAAGTTTLVTITILFGLVGLTAIVSSDSLLESWLTSMFLGVVCWLASSGRTRRVAANPSATKEARSGFFDFIETSDVFESGKSSSCWGEHGNVIRKNPRMADKLSKSVLRSITRATWTRARILCPRRCGRQVSSAAFRGLLAG